MKTMGTENKFKGMFENQPVPNDHNHFSQFNLQVQSFLKLAGKEHERRRANSINHHKKPLNRE